MTDFPRKYTPAADIILMYVNAPDYFTWEDGVLKPDRSQSGQPEKKAHAGESVEAGRAYLQAYVPYLHFVERLYLDASTPVAHGAEEGTHDVRAKPGASAEHQH